MNTYSTISGDTWDKIAFDQLGSEYLVPLLLEVNQKYRNIVIFSAGTVLNIPVIAVDDYNDAPEWIKDTQDTVSQVDNTEIIAEDTDS